jgi:hypothetical protein
MSPDIKTVQDDLAYMRALVQPKDQGQAPFGESYLAGGLIYGAQLVGHWFQATGTAFDPLAALALGVGPTVLFLAVLGWIIWRNRRTPQTGVANRAVALMFGSVGLANLALVAVFAPLALRERSLDIWLIYPCMVFVLQGAAWLVTGALRRRLWMGAVGLGWFADAIVMGLLIGTPGYMVAAAVGLFVLMAGSGAVMIVQARQAQAA